MEKTPPFRITFTKSLFFAGAAAIITACSGGSNSASSILPQNNSVTNAAPIPASSALPASSTSATAVPLSVSVSNGPTLMQIRAGGGSCPTSNKVTLGSQPASGDLIVIYAQLNNTGATLPAPSGFNTKDAQTGSWFRAAEFYKIATGSEGTSYTIPSNCTGSVLSWTVSDIKGENQSTPFDKHQATVNSTTGVSSFKTASLTPSHANDLPIAMIAAGSNGLTVSSVTPSNWVLGATGPNYTQKVYSGPLTGTTSVVFSETTSSATQWASLETIDLINPSNSANPTPTPPAATPTPAAPPATPTPASGTSQYTLYGCPVYTANDWFTTNLQAGGSAYATSTVDPNSAAIIANFDAAYGNPVFTGGSNATSMRYLTTPINEDNTNAPLVAPVQNLAYGFSDPYNDDSTKGIPWSSSYLEQGACGTQMDCHTAVLNTATCVDYETYTWVGPSYSAGKFTAESLQVHDLKHPYNSQIAGAGVVKAGFNYLGIVNIGEDEENYIAKGQMIPHIVEMIIPGSDSTNNTGNCATESCGVNHRVNPATGGFGCVAYCTANETLPTGARLRLHSSFTCPSVSSNPQAYYFCMQLKTYGAIVSDHGASESGCGVSGPKCTSSTFGLALASDRLGNDPWSNSDLSALTIHLSDFDVMTLGTQY